MLPDKRVACERVKRNTRIIECFVMSIVVGEGEDTTGSSKGQPAQSCYVCWWEKVVYNVALNVISLCYNAINY
jgi:hypothetical protein